MPVFPSCSLTSAMTRVSKSLTLVWMALNQAWAVAESFVLRITVCLASGEWISSCLEKQREIEGDPGAFSASKSYCSKANTMFILIIYLHGHAFIRAFICSDRHLVPRCWSVPSEHSITALLQTPNPLNEGCFGFL